MESRGEIFDKAHLNESSNTARKYFKQSGIKYSKINIEDCQKLRKFINQMCYELCDDESYSMIKDLEVNRKIKKNKYGTYLTMFGSYFDEREAITFWNPETNGSKCIEVGFCGWASGCNRIPIIQGFIKWCDWMVVQDAKEVIENE